MTLDPKTKKYTVIKNSLALLEPVLALAVLSLIQLSGASLRIKGIASAITQNRYGIIAIYALLFGATYYVITFYSGFYKDYVIEHRFGLSTQQLSGWIKDEIKRVALSLVMFLVFIEFLYFLLDNSPALWWLHMTLGWLFLSVIVAKVMPVFILPLFFKSVPLADSDLKGRLMRLAKRCDIRILDVFKLHLSAKTKKANAALVGMGRTRRVLLGDTLLDNYSKDEVEVVLAHELGHHKLFH
ncbi:MAG: M48 family metalloprotease, partial [Candidatus Omnitrophota bacterium]